MVKIGVLALQGAVREHVNSLQSPGAEVVAVKKIEQLEDLDGLVLPGGESTTMRRLIDKYGFFEPLKDFAKAGKPMFGTCAGLILMAKQLVGQNEGHLEIIDMEVERNAFGRQRESFEAELMVKGIAEDIMAVFIRAPLIKSVGEDVEILSKYNGEIVAVRQNQFLACSFHPELTTDARFHQYFVEIVKETKTKCLNV
ncbi:pyridoxal 5'-phosphate synthase glutaminase subunit PdxT [Anaerobacillus isosaccharinicus]|uniref:Pyridoxal 5'-phosphate synthase subunit PdxT n=1 Tax=Anaerobacillus isosaccharinicus TaxID=1532552 RepID=A0A1S2MFI2_9BACI|nr:pyridoxal 5'-phosphate synthase glutaminase subunit PdxT [Anaerobacillus isosaccharinicus]MBA5584195.1 pyridoxal 5'-phosphate synthase glutaminase subunit PdxT [Anaerobacillus isosaccharinicus]QOY37401.1 pyridoxal 5'-phosphate synthase glutaminase subunit PdxT [Anaerobacillus isosaccharinicus]